MNWIEFLCYLLAWILIRSIWINFRILEGVDIRLHVPSARCSFTIITKGNEQNEQKIWKRCVLTSVWVPWGVYCLILVFHQTMQQFSVNYPSSCILSLFPPQYQNTSAKFGYYSCPGTMWAEPEDMGGGKSSILSKASLITSFGQFLKNATGRTLGIC